MQNQINLSRTLDLSYEFIDFPLCKIKAIYRMLGADENAVGEMSPEARTVEIFSKMDINGDGVWVVIWNELYLAFEYLGIYLWSA